MLLEKSLVFLEKVASFLGIFGEPICSELIKVGVFFDQVGVVLGGVDDDMEQPDGAARVLGALFHEENVLGDVLWVERGFLLMGVF